MRVVLTIMLAMIVMLVSASAKTTGSAVFSYPIDGALNVSPVTSVAVTLPVSVDKQSVAPDAFTVTGTIGGVYSGNIVVSNDGKTVIFTPSTSFVLGESITAHYGTFTGQNGMSMQSGELKFTVASKLPHTLSSLGARSDDPILDAVLSPASYAHENSSPVLMKHGGNSPQGFPQLTVVNLDNPTEGDVYLANFKFTTTESNTYRMVLDDKGSIVFAQQAGPSLTLDFKPENNGTYTYFDNATVQMFVQDSNFMIIDSIRAANGYQTDGHELRYNPDGSYYIISLDPIVMDMRPYATSADSDATVLDDVVQEFDKDKNLIFEWRGLDHYKLTDIENEPLTGTPVDYCHMNAIEIDSDGNLLFSCRHLDEITKVNRETGDIMWRMGGKNNQFTFPNDTIGFSHQHAIRRTSAGTYTLFDNGNYHVRGGTFSRALEYKIDQTNKIASKLWEFKHQPSAYAEAMGYVERLSNGNTLIGWGACPTVAVTEVGPFNQTVFEMNMDSNNVSYRAFKYPANYIHSTASVEPTSSVTTMASALCVPNPMSDRAEVRFSMPQASVVAASLYNELGVEVRNLYSGELSSGNYSATLDAHGLSNGVYHIRISGEYISPIDEQVLIEH